MKTILSGKTEKHLEIFDQFLIDPEAKSAFIKLQDYAKRNGFDLQIVSAFRSYSAQENIWNQKALGQRDLYNESGDQILDYSKLNEEEIVHAIMRWSALPGASRHHWGTDIDVFDQNKKNKKDVELIISESETGGPFYELHLWLDEIIANNESFGFYRPYDIDRGGVSPEKWHLSYKPISKIYFENYTLDLFEEIIQESEIELKSYILKNLHDLYNKYITNIHP